MRIVVWDPSAELAEGLVFGGPKATMGLHSRGLVSLPVDPDLMGNHALGGYFRRSWGAGWAFDRMAATRGCPMMLLVVPDRQYIHWIARVQPVREGEALQGTIRLTTSTAQIGAMSGGLAAEVLPAELGKLGDCDDHGGWIIGGRNRVNVVQEGFIALNLYGASLNARIMWSAVSLSAQGE